MTFVPKRIEYCVLCLQLVSIFVVAATIRHQVTHIVEKSEEHVERRNINNDDVIPLRKLQQSRILLTSTSDHSHPNYYDKSKCVPRSHTYDNTVSTPAPNVFRVQWTLTTTTSTIATTTTTAEATTKISTFTIQFNRTWSPIGVDRMYQLVLDHYFDCAVFFRVVPGFIIQFGIASEPEETTKWDVIIPDDPMYVFPNIRGTLSFATAGPQTRTTQLFINTQDNHEYLDRMGFTPIGIVIINDDDDDDDTDAMDTIVPYIAKPNTKDGEDGISQDQYMKYGNHWIFQHYPEVDLIINTTLITSTINDESNDANEVVVDNEIEPSPLGDSITTIGRIPPQEDHQSHRFQNRQYSNENDGNL